MAHDRLDLIRAYLVNVEIRDTAIAALKEITEALCAELEPGTNSSAECAGKFVVTAVRHSPPMVDAVALQRDGIALEAFSTVTPSVTKLRALARERGWDDQMTAAYLIPTTGRVNTVRVIDIPDEYGEDDQ